MWRVLQPSGVELFTIELPTNWNVAAAIADRIAVLHRDELDVQTVQVYDVVGAR
jgi:hypothetical protein